MKKYLIRVLTLLWMIVIFSFSAKTADVSTQDSLWAGKKIGKLIITDFEKWTDEEQTVFAEKIEYPIRKGAHLTEYAILGILLLCSWDFSKHSLKNKLWCSWLLGTLYAASDEFHQLFVDGRSGQLTDVMIDSIGVMIGVLIAAALCKKKSPGIHLERGK